MVQEFNLKEHCRLVFSAALRAVDAGLAVRNAIKLSNSRLIICDQVYEVTDDSPIYAIAFGKAAYPMARAVDEVLGGLIKGGIVSGVIPEESKAKDQAFAEHPNYLSDNWQLFAGGHPLPNEASLAAAQGCFKLLEAANNELALVIFLVSGGGSAMIEAPYNNSITLTDLRETNRALISCGATIGEINLIRRAFSRIKGGGLAAFAPRTHKISLIVSDTEPGDEASVASGPTMESAPIDLDEVQSIINQYDLESQIPISVLSVLFRKPLEKPKFTPEELHRHHVLLDNQSALTAAVAFADANGFLVEVASSIAQQDVETGCVKLMERIFKLRRQANRDMPVCLISGGEFSCPVRGTGKGGRNSETVLRMAIKIDEHNKAHGIAGINAASIAFLSAGTDGIDGNSPAAGAICDETTVARALAFGLDAQRYLDNSNAYEFFDALGDAVITGPTGTNVRDLRIMIAG